MQKSTLGAVRADWEKKADEMEKPLPRVGRYPISGLIRSARRINDLSQRQMATMARVSPSTVGRVESGAMKPSLDLFQRLLATTGLYLVVVDQEGRIIQPMRECEHTRDGADRRYPSHLDTILDPVAGEWWADQYGLARPPETFYRDRKIRDMMRARSQWEVRVAQLRHAPEPMSLESFYARTEAERRRAEEGPNRVYDPIDPNDYDVDEYDDEEQAPSPTVGADCPVQPTSKQEAAAQGGVAHGGAEQSEERRPSGLGE